MKQIPVSLLTLVAGVVIAFVSLWVGQNHHLLPEQASQQAPLVDGFFNVMVTIATALFIVVEGAILIFAIKYRHRKGDDSDGVPIEGNFSVEIFWTAIPAIIVIGLGIYSVEVYRAMGGFDPAGYEMVAHHHGGSSAIAKMPGSAIAAPIIADSEGMVAQTAKEPVERKYGIGAAPEEEGKAASLVVDVTAMQYAWIFNYPDSGITSGELHVPVGKDVLLNITAIDVIHSLWIPQFRIKQDAIPGQPTQLRFVATKEGDFPIVCTELCGSYHGGMRARAIVETPEKFESWMTENQIAQQQESSQIVAANPADLPTSEFLAPYAKEMGIDAHSLIHLHPGAIVSSMSK
ncbi:cytochrome c oxidase subunit II [Aerosakkonemataceae cyanobacterium BLCC-F154]|uniref:Cytochrome c oxidase subunit 2 n=1 Tax=Floridaenema fluviatile BLCC-F154 TaxID=3153640 RepID=A0ABV4YKB6_9CYAN